MTTNYVEQTWRDQAVCTDIPVADFIPDDPRAKPPAHVVAACAKCPVKDECLMEAIANKELGYWGGTTYQERLKIAKNAYNSASGMRWGGGGKRIPVCGTASAYSRHRRLGEKPCAACTEAWRRDSRERMARKRGSVGTRRLKDA